MPVADICGLPRVSVKTAWAAQVRFTKISCSGLEFSNADGATQPCKIREETSHRSYRFAQRNVPQRKDNPQVRGLFLRTHKVRDTAQAAKSSGSQPLPAVINQLGSFRPSASYSGTVVSASGQKASPYLQSHTD
jgi:hypothetical protein